MTSPEPKRSSFTRLWGGREWNTWPVFPLLLIGAAVCLIVSASTSDWTLLQAWMMTCAFVISGTMLMYWVQAPLKAPIYQARKRRAYLLGMGSAFSFRWILLGVPLFVAVLNPQFFSVAVTAACVLITPLLFVGSSLTLHILHTARRKQDVTRQDNPA